MSSSWNGLDLFGSGPHRFAVGPIGELVLSQVAMGSYAPGSVAIGPVELDVIVTGRLVAASDAALWVIRDAIGAQLTDPPTSGTLIDHHGRSWPGMSFIRFESADRTDRGRVVSLGYRAVFREFYTP